jgi:hypothetical protein
MMVMMIMMMMMMIMRTTMTIMMMVMPLTSTAPVRWLPVRPKANAAALPAATTGGGPPPPSPTAAAAGVGCRPHSVGGEARTKIQMVDYTHGLITNQKDCRVNCADDAHERSDQRKSRHRTAPSRRCGLEPHSGRGRHMINPRGPTIRRYYGDSLPTSHPPVFRVRSGQRLEPAHWRHAFGHAPWAQFMYTAMHPFTPCASQVNMDDTCMGTAGEARSCWRIARVGHEGSSTGILVSPLIASVLPARPRTTQHHE